MKRKYESICWCKCFILFFNGSSGIWGKGWKIDKKILGKTCTSSLTVWLLYVLTKDKNVVKYLEDLEIEILPLTFEILKMASEIKELDFEDAIHFATMKVYRIKKIISNDKDFDKVCERIFWLFWNKISENIF